MKIWFEEYGWQEDPFSIRPSSKLLGLEKERKSILNYIATGTISLITGNTGSGKSSILLWLEKQLQTNDFTPIRINCAEKYSGRDLIKKILSYRTLKDKFFFRKFPQKPVLLLDEAQFMLKETAELIKVKWDDKQIHSIVLASINKNLENFTGSFKDRVVGQLVNLPNLSLPDAVNMIKVRTGDICPFDDSVMTTIIDVSNNIPRRILETCRNLCIYAIEHDISHINKYHVFEVTPLATPSVEIEPPITPPQRQERQATLERQEIERQTRQRQKTGVFSPIESKKGETLPKPQTLSPMQTKIIELLEKKELNAEKIANNLKTSIGSVRKQLSRLKKGDLITIANHTTTPISYKLTDEFHRYRVRE